MSEHIKSGLQSFMHFFLTEVPCLGKPIESNNNQIKILLANNQ